MRWMLALAIVAACGSKSTTGSVDAAGDAVVTGTDARAGIDGAAGVVACGTATQPMTCALPQQACCDFAPGTGSDYCYAVSGGICEGGAPITCDGPEDCAGSERCCYKSTGSTCTAGPDCAPGGSGGQIMCHVGDDAPCAPNGRCCSLHVGPTSAPLGACRVGACPG